MAPLGPFRRGQALWALWRLFDRVSDTADPPRSFVVRARNLGSFGVPIGADQRPGQSGIDVLFDEEEVFELGIALLLSDSGIGQQQAAFLVRHLRGELRAAHRKIIQLLVPPRSAVLRQDNPPRLANTSAFLCFRHAEIREAWPDGQTTDDEWTGERPPPLFIGTRDHYVLYGVEAMAKELDWLAGTAKAETRIIIELSSFARTLRQALAIAPDIRRGRP
jgi:hypothetical protein